MGKGKFFKAAIATVPKTSQESTLVADDWYRRVLCPEAPAGGWFGLWDCFSRYLLTFILFYWCILTDPIRFATYTYKYNSIWYGAPGLLLTASFPVLPLAIVVLELLKKIKGWFHGPDWMMAGPGRVFFVKPPNPVSDLLWSCYLNQSMFCGQYLLAGTHPDAISHTWVDTILTKDFWRQHLEGVTARVPRELGRWADNKFDVFHDIGISDVVCKIPDAYLGIGDSFWNHGEHFKTKEELVGMLKETYADKECLVLELVRPRASLGVHSLDILTIRVPGGEVKVLSVILWTDCTTNSSHSCRAGYVVDVESETIVSAASWYAAGFATMDAPLIGTKYPGVKEACQKAVAAHSSIKEKWLVAVGWDAMVMEKDEIVFFEGNFAGARTPRRMFLTFSAMVSAMWHVFWPFGDGNSVQPHL